MSTFSGLNTAYSSLTAHRLALEVAGQNVANANTVGYTRQRLNMDSITAAPGSFASTEPRAGNGVEVKGIERLGDIFIDARVRSTGSASAHLMTRADAYSRVESIMNEPSDTGISNAFNELWAGFQEVAKSPQTLATKQVVLERAQSLIEGLSTGYTSIERQWSEHRTELLSHVSDVNAAARAVAELNGQIQVMTASESNSNELQDKRQLIVQELSELTGATARFRDDGTVDVSIGGNLLVSGKSAQQLEVSGATTMAQVVGTPPSAMQVVWSRPGAPVVNFDGGSISGLLEVTATQADGGLLTSTAAGYNAVATELATQVNAILQGADGGNPLFTVTGDPAAKSLKLALTDPSDLKVAAPGQGNFDGSVADLVAQLGTNETGPSAHWKTLVVTVGTSTKSAITSAEVAFKSFETASTLQLSGASVDVDEETVNMLSYQRGYQAASRVLTTIDEMLDQLINRTGVVGR